MSFVKKLLRALYAIHVNAWAVHPDSRMEVWPK